MHRMDAIALSIGGALAALSLLLTALLKLTDQTANRQPTRSNP